MYSQVVSSGSGVHFSSCGGVRDFLPSASGREFSFSGVVRQFRVLASGIPEDLRCRGSKLVQIRQPLLRIIRSRPLEQTSSGIPPAEADVEGISTSARRKNLPRLQPANCLRSIFDTWLQVNFPGWTAEFSTSSLPQGLVVSVLASFLFLYTPTADALGFFTPRVAGNSAPVSGSNVSQQEVQDSEAFRARVSVAIDLLEKGQSAQARGDFCEALDFYEEVKQTAGDLALAEYARVGHAVTLYEVGDRSEAIIEMEDVSIALRGYPEIHAALAAALYADKHAPMPAEKQFNIATLLDPRYTNVQWVAKTKHWPPSLLNSLKQFISLQ